MSKACSTCSFSPSPVSPSPVSTSEPNMCYQDLTTSLSLSKMCDRLEGDTALASASSNLSWPGLCSSSNSLGSREPREVKVLGVQAAATWLVEEFANCND